MKRVNEKLKPDIRLFSDRSLFRNKNSKMRIGGKKIAIEFLISNPRGFDKITLKEGSLS